MADMMDLINRELAKIQQGEARYGKSSSDYAIDTLSAAYKIGADQRAWNERKSSQRQQIMSELARGTSTTFNDTDLKAKKERFQNYFNKIKNSSDSITTELADIYLENFDIQGNKNKEFNIWKETNEKFEQDMAYDVQNIGYDIDEDGNKIQRTLNEDDYKIITDNQLKFIEHAEQGQTNFADRLSLKPFQHINTRLANSRNANEFLLQQAREDNLIDDQELQVYMDAWNGLNTDGIKTYNSKQAAVDGTILKSSGEQMMKDMQEYETIYNFLYGSGELEIEDTAFLDNKFKGTIGQYIAGKNKGKEADKQLTKEDVQDLYIDKLQNLDQKIANADENVFQRKSQGISLMGDSNFVRHLDRDAFKISKDDGISGDTIGSGSDTKEIVPTAKEDGANADEFINNWKDEAAIGAVGAYSLYQVSKKSIDYVKSTLKIAEESKISNFLQSPDAQKETRKIHSVIDKIKKLDSNDPSYNAKKKTYTKRINKLASEFAKKHGYKFDATKDDIIKLMKNADKWNIWRVKNTVGRGLRQTYKTGEDLLKVAGKGGAKISPLTGGVMGWHLGEELGLGTTGKLATAYGGVKGTQKLYKAIGKKGWGKAIANPKLRSKLSGFVIKKAPWLAAKMGLKMGAGALSASTGIGAAVSVGMGAWALNDIRTIIQDIPEVKQLFIDYTEGKFDEE